MPTIRKDIPPPNVNTFPERIREEISVLIGKRGDPLDKAVTVRDLLEGGLIKVSPGYAGGNTSQPPIGDTGEKIPTGGPSTYEPDLTPPPSPSGLTAAAALTSIFIEHDSPAYTQGHGHLRTRVYGAKYTSGALPTFANAVEIGQFTGRTWAFPAELGTQWRLWAKWETVDGVLSASPAGGTNGVMAQTGLVGGANIADLAIEAGKLADGTISATKLAAQAVDATKFASGIEPVTVVTGSTVPTTKSTSTIFLTGTGKLYRWSGTAYVASTPASDVTGQLTDAQIAAMSAAKLTGQVVASQIADASLTTAKFASSIEPLTIVTGALPTTKSTSTIYRTDDSKVYRWNGTAYVATVPTADLTGTVSDAQIAGMAASKVTGTLSDSQIAAVSAAKLTGTISAAQIADGSVSGTKFASGIEPLTIVTGTLPTTKSTSAIYRTDDSKVYRWNGTAYVASISTSDLSGTIADAQIAGMSAAKVTGTLTDSQLSAVSAAKITGTIVASQIADSAITTAKFAAGIEPVEIVGALPSSGNFQGRIAFLTTDNKLYRHNGSAWVSSTPATDISGTLSDSQLAAISAAKITGTISASQIADGSISGTKFASGIEPINIITGSTLPTTKSTNAIYLTGTGKLYWWVGGAYAASINTSDLLGTISDAQIAGMAASKVSGTLSDSQLAAISAAKVTGQITGTQITDNAITTAKIAAGAVTAANIAADTITASQIAANAITSAELAAGAVVAGKIAAGTIQAADIAAGTITGDRLAANTITASQIAADTITAGQLAAGAVTSSEIAANAVTAGAIAAGAVTTAKLSAGAVTANEIAAGAVVAGKIAASAVTASELAAGAVTAGKIAAGAVTATELSAGAVTAGKIAAGAVSATEIAAGAIRTDKLLVTGRGRALNDDPMFTDQSAWALLNTPVTFVNYTGVGAPGNAGTTYVESYAGGSNSTVQSRRMPINPSKTYKLTANLYAAAGNNRNMYIYVRLYKADGSELTGADTGWGGNFAGYVFGGNPATGVWTEYGGQFGAGVSGRPIPSTAAFVEVGVWFQYSGGGTSSAQQAAQNLRFEETVAGDLIVDGAITAAKITAGSITGDRLAANTITASQIAGQTITATQIASGTITSANIAAGTIQASNIAAGSITGDRLAANTVTASQIAGNTITAGQIAAGAIGASQIAAGSITGDRLAANTITASQIASATITAANIAADTITASQIAASAITSAELAAGAVVAGKIAAGTIQAADIAAGTITGDRLAANTVSADKLVANSITAGQIATGAIGASQIAAGAITTDKLLVTGQGKAINDDPTFADPSAWQSSGTGSYVLTGDSSAPVAGRFLRATGPTNFETAPALPIEGGKQYKVSMWARKPTGAGLLYIRLYCWDNTWTLQNYQVTALSPSTGTFEGLTAATVGTAWQKFTGYIIPANTATRAKLLIHANWTGDGYTDICDLRLEEYIGSDLIVDGAITASKIQAGAIQVGSAIIADGAITNAKIATLDAGKITTGQMDAARISATWLTAGQISAGAIGASQIAAGAISTDKLLVTGQGAALNDDPNTQDISAWSGGNISIVPDATAPSGSALTVLSVGASTLSRRFPLDASKNYNLRMSAKTVSGSAITYLLMAFFDGSDQLLSASSYPANWPNGGTYHYFGLAGAPAPAAYTEYQVSFGPGETFKIPAGAKYGRVGVLANYNGPGEQRFTSIRLVEKASADLIVDGSIIASKLSVGAIAVGSGVIQNGAITNALIGSLAVDTAKIADGAIVTAKIGDAQITNAKIGDAQITNAKITTLDASKITTGTLDAARIAAGSITANKINGAGLNIYKSDGVTPVLIANDDSPPWVTKNASPAAGSVSLVGGTLSGTNSAYVKGVFAGSGVELSSADDSVTISARASEVDNAAMGYGLVFSGAAAAVTGASVALEANSFYRLTAAVRLAAGATTATPILGLSLPSGCAGTGSVTAQVNSATAAERRVLNWTTAGGNATATFSAMTLTTYTLATIEAIFATGATAGSATLLAGSGVSSITVDGATFMSVQKARRVSTASPPAITTSTLGASYGKMGGGVSNAIASITLSFTNTGTWSIATGSGTPTSGNWFSPTGTPSGNLWEVQFVVTTTAAPYNGGSLTFSNTAVNWTSVGTTQSILARLSHGDVDDATVSVSIYFRPAGSGGAGTLWKTTQFALSVVPTGSGA